MTGITISGDSSGMKTPGSSRAPVVAQRRVTLPFAMLGQRRSQVSRFPVMPAILRALFCSLINPTKVSGRQSTMAPRDKTVHSAR